MTVTIELSPVAEKELRITAEANDLTLEAYLSEIAEREAREDAADRATLDAYEREAGPAPRKTLDDLRRVLGKPAKDEAAAR